MRPIHLLYVNAIHAEYTRKKTEHPCCLHVFNKLEPVAQVSYLPMNNFFITPLQILRMKRADTTGKCKKTIGMRQHDEADGREQQSRRVDANIHAAKLRKRRQNATTDHGQQTTDDHDRQMTTDE